MSICVEKFLMTGCILCCASIFTCAVAAQTFPTRPVRLALPYPPGGANDDVARLLALKVTEQLGQQIVVDNRGSGNTIIDSELVAKAAPDGYTLLIVAAGHAVNPALYPKLPYDAARDFAQVVLTGDGAHVLVAHPSAGVKMLHVPYKGGRPAVLDLLGGRVAVFFPTVAVARPNNQSSKIKALGVITGKRSAALPNQPTIAEAGLLEYDVSGWYGVVAPVKTPTATIQRITSVVRLALRQPDIEEKLLAVGVEASDVSVEQFDKFLRADLVK